MGILLNYINAIPSLLSVISVVSAIANWKLGSATIFHPNTISPIAPISSTTGVRQLPDKPHSTSCIYRTSIPSIILAWTSYYLLSRSWGSNTQKCTYTKTSNQKGRSNCGKAHNHNKMLDFFQILETKTIVILANCIQSQWINHIKCKKYLHSELHQRQQVLSSS